METRDKLFTEEQYLKQLKLYNEEILYYEQKHLSGKHIGYDSLFNYRLRSLLVQYSMGQDIDNRSFAWQSCRPSLHTVHCAG